MLDGAQVQRLASHAARHSGRAVHIVADALRRMERPGESRLARAIPLDTKTRRFRAAQALADVVRNFADLHHLEPWLLDVGRSWGNQGLDLNLAHQATAAFIEALRSHAGADWSPQLAQDWRAALEPLFVMLARGAARAAAPSIARAAGRAPNQQRRAA